MNKFVCLVLLAFICIASAENIRNLQSAKPAAPAPSSSAKTVYQFSTMDYSCDPLIYQCPCDPEVEDCSCWDCYVINNELICVFTC